MGLDAGLDLEMPYKNEANDQKIEHAVKDGVLDEKVLDNAVKRMLRITYMGAENEKPDAVYDKNEHHRKARELAAECMVLLKNENNLLPLPEKTDVAVIGAFAPNTAVSGRGCGSRKADYGRQPPRGNPQIFSRCGFRPGISAGYGRAG